MAGLCATLESRMTRASIVLAVTLLAAPGCAPRRIDSTPLWQSSPCQQAIAGAVAWVWHPDAAERPRQDRWCMGVGAPLVTHAAPGSGQVRRLLVLSWNVHVGGGRIEEVVSRLLAGASSDTGVVLLLQEVFRAGAAVPDRVYDDDAIADAIRPHRPAPDIAALATRLGLSLAYVPSMRNGPATNEAEREDRGSAILSSEPLSGITAIELPFGRQRRIAVMATVTPRGGRPLQVISAHLDVARGTRRQAAYLAGYLAGATADVPRLLGIDTNAMLGTQDPAFDSLKRVLPVETCGKGRTSSWLARVDFIFSSLAPSVARTCERFTDRHGSDHVPLLLTVDLDPQQPVN